MHSTRKVMKVTSFLVVVVPIRTYKFNEGNDWIADDTYDNILQRHPSYPLNLDLRFLLQLVGTPLEPRSERYSITQWCTKIGQNTNTLCYLTTENAVYAT